MRLARRAAIAVLLVAATSRAQQVTLWPGELQGSVTLVAPEVLVGANQGLLAGPLAPTGARVTASSLLAAPARLGGEAETTDTMSSTGLPPTSWSSRYRLIVPPHGGGFEVAALVTLENGATYVTSPLSTPCLPSCLVSAGVLTDAGCDPACADCLPCDPVAVRAGLDLVEEIGFVRVEFTHACRAALLVPTAAHLAVHAGDVLRAELSLANPDTGGPDELRLVVPAGVPLTLLGRAALGRRAVDISVTEDPRVPGAPLVVVPGEELTVTIGPLVGADLPPGFVVRPSDPRECDPADTGSLRGSFGLRDATPQDDTTLLSLGLAITDGPSDGAFALGTPAVIPPGGIPPGATAQVEEWRIDGLLPNLATPAELAPLDGDRYATGDFRFELRPDPDALPLGLPLARGTSGGFDGAVALLSNDPTFDLASCGLDPADPALAVVAAQAPLVVLYNAAPLVGLESLNTVDHRACAPTGGALAISADRRDDLVTDLPSFVSDMRPARVPGLFRIVDATVQDDGTILEIGVEKALVTESFALGSTTSLASVGAQGLPFETTRGTTAETVPEVLDVAALTPPELDARRDLYGTPGLEDPAALDEADLAARGVAPLPDLSVEDNRAALDASETYLAHEQVVALAANVPGPVTTRTHAIRLGAAGLESPLDEGGIRVEGLLRVVDVTKPAHRSAITRTADLRGPLPSTYPGGVDFPSIAMPVTLLEDSEGLTAGTVIDTSLLGSDLFLDPAISDGSFRYGTTHANDGPDSTVDTEPTPDPDPNDNDAVLDPTAPRDPVLVKPDDDLSTRSRLLDRLTLEPGEVSVESFGACFGAVRLVVRAAAGYRLEQPWVTGRGFLNAEGRTGTLTNIRPDLGVDLNEDGVADQYLVLYDGPGEGFKGGRKDNGRGHAAASVVLFLPAGDHVLEPHAIVRDGPTGEGVPVDFPTIEVSVTCGSLTLVTEGDAACPLTQGFWRRQCAGPHPSGESENLPTYVDAVNDLATFADVVDVASLCDRMSPQPPDDKCEQAEAQLMAAALNLASGRVGPAAVVELGDVGGDDALDVEDASDLLAAMDALLGSPTRTVEDCRLAQELAAAFNERRLTPASAACDGTVDDGDDTMEEGEGPPPPVDNSFRLWKVPEGLRMKWNDLPRGLAGSYEVVSHAWNQGVPPAAWVMDGLADVVLTTVSGELGESIPLPPGQLVFFKVRGLSPTLGIPGPTRERGR